MDVGSSGVSSGAKAAEEAMMAETELRLKQLRFVF